MMFLYVRRIAKLLAQWASLAPFFKNFLRISIFVSVPFASVTYFSTPTPPMTILTEPDKVSSVEVVTFEICFDDPPIRLFRRLFSIAIRANIPVRIIFSLLSIVSKSDRLRY